MVFGLSPQIGTDDDDRFRDLVKNELNFTPHIVSSSRLGGNGKPPPLRISLHNDVDKHELPRNIKNLRSFAQPDVKQLVFINPHFTL